MAKTLIDVDESLLMRAQSILGTTTKKQTVNSALKEVVRREAALQFVKRAAAGIFATPGAQRTRSC